MIQVHDKITTGVVRKNLRYQPPARPKMTEAQRIDRWASQARKKQRYDATFHLLLGRRSRGSGIRQRAVATGG